MFSVTRIIVVATAVAVLFPGATTARAAATAEQKCQAGKNKLAGAYSACQANAEAKRATKGNAEQYRTAIGKCTAKFSAGWVKLEAKAAKAGRTCLDGAPTVEQFRPVIADHVTRVAAALGGDEAALQLCSVEQCGNGVIDVPESCDGTQLGGATCQSLGFVSGTLACTAGCGFNLAGCVPRASSQCGNGVVDAPESCDGAQLGVATCQSLGFASGTLACTPGCGFDLSACVAFAPDTCGNGTINSGEDCDDTDLGGRECSDLTYCPDQFNLCPFPGDRRNFEGGTLRCASNCRFDRTGCYRTRFEETNLTVIDNETGLEWEKKTGNASDPPIPCDDTCGTSFNNVRLQFTWGILSSASGGVFRTFLGALNGSLGFCYAGHCDWRLPTLSEMQSIQKPAPCAETRCIASPVFGPNQQGGDPYWLVNTANVVSHAAFFDFTIQNSATVGMSKTEALFARAVRTR